MVLRPCRRRYLAGQGAVVPGLAGKVLSILWHLHGALGGGGAGAEFCTINGPQSSISVKWE